MTIVPASRDNQKCNATPVIASSQFFVLAINRCDYGDSSRKITKDAVMIGKFARAEIAALVLGSSVMAAGTLPA